MSKNDLFERRLTTLEDKMDTLAVANFRSKQVKILNERMYCRLLY